MDFEYLQDLKNSGCEDLNFGIESGSQPVLDAMKKNTTVPVVEQNLQDCYQVGITSTTNWMLGFPNETTNDFARTITLAWRMQPYIVSMARQAMNLGPSRVANNPSAYGIHPKEFLGSWANADHSNTKIHRLVRVKSFNILVEHMPAYSRKDQDHNKRLIQSYDFNLDLDSKLPDDRLEDLVAIPYEDFDYNIIQDPQLDTVFKRTVVNEIWALIRTMWRSQLKSAMNLTVKFDPDWDYNQHGSGIAGDKFSAVYNFTIDSQGQWNADCVVKFDPPENPYSPWYKPDTDEILNYAIDLSWTGSGQWH
jgi:hypothetical protein